MQQAKINFAVLAGAVGGGGGIAGRGNRGDAAAGGGDTSLCAKDRSALHEMPHGAAGAQRLRQEIQGRHEEVDGTGGVFEAPFLPHGARVIADAAAHVIGTPAFHDSMDDEIPF